jgi:hypothetical protein
MNNVLNTVARLTRPTGLAFVPEVIALVGKDALLQAAKAELVELRPEGGLGRLSVAERDACPAMRDGTPLSWCRIW